MADLSDWRDGTRRQRGQMILVTGFILAVSFVALAVVLNSVIYTENLATRSEAAKASDAVKVKSDMADATAEIIRYINQREAHGGASYPELYDLVKLGVNNTTQYAQDSQLRNGQIVNATAVAFDKGTVINQTFEEKDFTDDDGNQDWTLVTDANGIRGFWLNVTRPGDVADANDPTSSTPNNFTIIVTGDSGDTWQMEISHDNNGILGDSGESGYIVSYLVDGSKGYCGEIDAAGGFFTVDVSDGTFNGTKCRALQFGRELDPPYDLRYENAHNVYGNYSVLVNQSEGVVDSGQFNDHTSSDTSDPPPITDAAIYDAKILVEYEEQRMTYQTDARAFPEGEDD